MIKTIGMIGTGNMGSAILRGVVDAEYIRANQIIAFDVSRKRLHELCDEIPGVTPARDCREVAERADLILIAVKPMYVREVIEEMKPALNGKAEDDTGLFSASFREVGLRWQKASRPFRQSPIFPHRFPLDSIH